MELAALRLPVLTLLNLGLTDGGVSELGQFGLELLDEGHRSLLLSQVFLCAEKLWVTDKAVVAALQVSEDFRRELLLRAVDVDFGRSRLRLKVAVIVRAG